MTHYTKSLLAFLIAFGTLYTVPLYSQPSDKNSDFHIWFDQEVENINEYLESETELALQTALQLLETAKKKRNNLWYIAKAKDRIAVSYYYLNDLSLSNKYNLESLLLFDSLNDKENKALVLNNIGWNYRMLDRNEMAILYMERSLKLFREMDDKQRMQGVLNNLGTAYRRDPVKFDQALSAFGESLEINRALGNKTWEAYNLNNIGLIYLDQGVYDKAIDNFQEALSLNIDMDKQEQVCRNYLNLSLSYLSLHKVDSAAAYSIKARQILDENNFPKTEYVYWEYKVELEKEQQNYQSALEAHIRMDEYEWERHEKEYENRIAELEVKYNMALKDKQLKEAKNKVRTAEILALLILLISIILLLVKVYFEKTKWLHRSEHLLGDINEKVKLLKDFNDENERIKNNLQKLIREETAQITSQNEKLKKYAFINAHLIRGPLARIMGLVNVIKLENEELKNCVAINKLNESSNELDHIVRNISEVLNNDDELFPG